MPLGSGNDLARSLGLPADPASAWRVAIGSATRRIDVARARNGSGAERWFASAGGIGFDAQVAAAMTDRRGWQAGRAGYLLTTISELRRYGNRPITLDDRRHLDQPRRCCVAIANGSYYGGGMRIAPDARTDDGVLDVCVVGDISRLTAVRQLPNLYRGTHVRHPQVTTMTGRTVEVEGDGDARPPRRGAVRQPPAARVARRRRPGRPPRRALGEHAGLSSEHPDALLGVLRAVRRRWVARGGRVAGHGAQGVDASVAEALVVAGQPDVDRRRLEQRLAPGPAQARRRRCRPAGRTG